MFISVTFRILSFHTLPVILQKKSTSNFPQITPWQLSAFHKWKYPFPTFKPCLLQITSGELESQEPNLSSPLVITSSRGQWNAAIHWPVRGLYGPGVWAQNVCTGPMSTSVMFLSVLACFTFWQWIMTWSDLDNCILPIPYQLLHYI